MSSSSVFVPNNSILFLYKVSKSQSNRKQNHRKPVQSNEKKEILNTKKRTEHTMNNIQ